MECDLDNQNCDELANMTTAKNGMENLMNLTKKNLCSSTFDQVDHEVSGNQPVQKNHKTTKS